MSIVIPSIGLGLGFRLGLWLGFRLGFRLGLGHSSENGRGYRGVDILTGESTWYDFFRRPPSGWARTCHAAS